MRIGILTNTFPPNLNGVSLAVDNLVKALKQVDVEVFVATPRIEGVKYPEYVLPLRSFPLPKQVSSDLRVPYLFAKDASEFFADHQIDLLHSHETFFGGLEGAEIARKLDIPSVHTYHTYIEAYGYVDLPGYKLFIRNFSRQVCNQYDHIITLSAKIDTYLQKIKVKTPRSRLLNHYNFQALQPVPADPVLAGQLGLQPDDFLFFSFCRLAKEKGLDRGLKAMAELVPKHPNIKYIISGFGPDRERLQELASELGLADKVIFTGKYTTSDLPALAALADVFLFTSTTENLPTNALEAVALGLPVISVDDSSIEYVLTNGYNGLRVGEESLALACQAVLLNPDLRAGFAANSLKQAEQIRKVDITKQYTDLYSLVIDNYHNQPRKPKIDMEDLVRRYLQTETGLLRDILRMWD